VTNFRNGWKLVAFFCLTIELVTERLVFQWPRVLLAGLLRKAITKRLSDVGITFHLLSAGYILIFYPLLNLA